MFKSPVWILFLLCAPLVGYEQPRCKIDHYSTEEGLSNDRITSILKDSEGFMWFGTWDGLNRFDGHNFVTYKSYPGDLSKLKNDRIDEIQEDKTFYLWLKDYDKQVYRFDKRTEHFLPLSDIIKDASKQKLSFERIISNDKGTVWLLTRNQGIFFIPNTNLPDGRYIRYGENLEGACHLPSNLVNFLYQDQLGQVWIGTPKGLVRLTRDKTGGYTNSGRAIDCARDNTLNYTAVAEDTQNVYFCTTDGFFVVYDKITKTSRHKQLPVEQLNNLCVSKKSGDIYCSTGSGQLLRIGIADLSVTATGFKAGEPVYAMHEDETGCLWVEPSREGIIRFDPSNGSLNKYVQQKDALYFYRNEHAKVFEDNKGIVWVVMKSSGFGYYNNAMHSFEYFYDGPDRESHRFSNMVNCIYYDRSGILWLSTDMPGLEKIIFPDNYFDQHLLVNNTFFRSDNEVRGIYTDRKNRLWIGTKTGRLYVRKDGKDAAVRFIGKPPEGFGPIYSILQDHNGVIWLGTKQNGLFRAEPVDSNEETYAISHYKDEENDANSLNGNDVYTIVEDKQGRVWAGTFDKGLNQVVTENQRTSFISTKNALRAYPQNSFNKIRHMACDEKGNLWIGTTTGLLVMDANGKTPANYRFTGYSKIPGDKESLGNNDVQFIFMDQHHRMWLLTSGGGLCRCLSSDIFKSLTCKNYTTNDGLPNDYLVSCLEDKQHNLWLCTQKGIARFNTNTGQIRNYNSDDGLPKSRYAEASCTKLADGTLVFGSVNGYLSFNPEKIIDHKIDTRVALTNLQVNNQNRVSGDRDSILHVNINYAADLKLNYNQNNISIDYMLLDYRTVSDQEYVYRLKGFDTIWHNNQSQQRATYNNLPPGNYTFEVKSQNSERYLHQPVTSLAITILPPPWRTWWAYMLYILTGAIILEVIRRTGVAMLRLRQRIAIEQKMTELKLNFFTNVSHELRTPLTLILNPVQQIASRENLSQQGKAYIDIVQKNAGRMVRFINQLLDLRKAQSGKATLKISRVEIVSFIKHMGEYFSDTAHEKQITLDIVTDTDELYVFIDAEKIDIVIYNLLVNAFKFSPPGKRIQVNIAHSVEKGNVTITVSDEGTGVPEKILEDIFELYFEEGHSNNNNMKGSGIGLALSREMVALHHGKIWAENNSQHGLSVIIELLLGKAHYAADECSYVDLPEISASAPGEAGGISAVFKNTFTGGQASALPMLLLVEDNFELQALLKSQLSVLFRIEVASNGEEGLQKALLLVPDLILSDVMMPLMDGITMLSHLRNNTATSHIPIVLLSAKSSVENQVEGLQYGADLYLTKPFNNNLLMASLANLLNQRKKLFEMLSPQKAAKVGLNARPITITSGDELFLKQVIDIVEKGMEDPDFNIDLMAGSMNMARSTFYKKFKSLTNMTLVEFIRDMRLQRSKQYMDAGETNISGIAYAVGFNDARYFSTCFREKYNCTPTEYLKAHVKTINTKLTD